MSASALTLCLDLHREPNLKTVRELVYKRGYGKINKQRIPLSSNQVIEENLGQYGIISIEVRCSSFGRAIVR